MSRVNVAEISFSDSKTREQIHGLCNMFKEPGEEAGVFVDYGVADGVKKKKRHYLSGLVHVMKGQRLESIDGEGDSADGAYYDLLEEMREAGVITFYKHVNGTLRSCNVEFKDGDMIVTRTTDGAKETFYATRPRNGDRPKNGDKPQSAKASRQAPAVV